MVGAVIGVIGDSRQFIVVEDISHSVKCINFDYLTTMKSRTYYFNKNTIKVIRQLDKNELEILKLKLEFFKTPANLKIRK